MTEMEINIIVERLADRLSDKIVEKQASSPEWMEAHARAMMKVMSAQQAAPRLISARQAAQQLGISIGHLYHIKEHFTYVKGESKSSPLRFDESKLHDEYKAYLEGEGRMANPFLEPIRRAL